ncbi:glycerate kinase [Shewanella litorisediminis]|uniref:Glycerate kinase n=1 Tax=Shewanella litorisediminis TaxID=1173586 RepID=A0ABX7G6U7_9GAMM|nr:glycerate kinase [Shewanella litorisediminis]MCL2916897.1 glycerate kinase [Shewanella litorisediminis]QRH02937.1 glycerate kinase [Shewanella litorisediminis]
MALNILIAPDAFKESLSAAQVADTVRLGLSAQLGDAKIVQRPLADGGEGTCEILTQALGGELRQFRVTGPDGEPVTAILGWVPARRTAIIEMAQASGLMLIPPERRNPLSTSTYGFGELIKEALALGARQLILTLGGSATNDGGAGMLAALGLSMLDSRGQRLTPRGGNLADIEVLCNDSLDTRLQDCQIQVACDVENPLLGPTGAVAVFAPQKGADAKALIQLEAGLSHWANLVEQLTGNAFRQAPGAGAAGGTGFAAMALLRAQMTPGAQLVASTLGLEQAVMAADVVITGEGCLDGQTLNGKAPFEVLRLAKRHQKIVIGLAGRLGAGHQALLDAGFTALIGTVAADYPKAQALAGAEQNLLAAAQWLGRALQQGKPLLGSYPQPGVAYP